ncbi:hypothetical protein Tco_1510816 [Tanacetum coccineum]
MSSVGRKSNAIFALPGHGSTSSVGGKSNAIFALPGHGSTSSVGRKSNAIFALSDHGSMSSVGLYYTAFIIWRRMVGKCARLCDALFKAREEDERYQESRQDRPDQIKLQHSYSFDFGKKMGLLMLKYKQM